MLMVVPACRGEERRGEAHWVCYFVKRQPYWGGSPVCCLFRGQAKVIQGNKIERRAA